MKDPQERTAQRERPIPGRDVVDLGDAGDIELWTRSLGISREDLERAVAAVGPAAGDVYDFIARDRMHGTR